MSSESLAGNEGTQNAFDMYGRVKEGVHVAGYTFERACSHLEWLLDEDRWKLGGRFDNVNTFLESIKLDQFRIVTDERKRIAKRIKELQPDATVRTIAKVVGAAPVTVHRDLQPVPNETKKSNEPAPEAGLDDAPVPNETKPHTEPQEPPPQSSLSGAEAAKITTVKATQNAVSAKKKAENDEIAARPVVFPEGTFGTIVIDPPWPMEKIERDVAPNQAGFEYPTMDENQLVAFGGRVNGCAADDCHLFMWTTHKHLPLALRLLDDWDWRYVLTMVWHKNGGFQPFGLPQYNCEFCVYARRGAPKFTDTKAFNVCFQAPRREHSRKPDEFYDLVRRVTADGRIDIFSREPRDGFAQLGNESDKFTVREAGQ